jgi:hypothetical protein
MKLPIKDKYFKQIKQGVKEFEFRDAHITFINEKTGETLRKDVYHVEIIPKEILDDDLDKNMFEDDLILVFGLDLESDF